MIMTVAEFKMSSTTALTDTALELKLQALESSIRAFTHNNFQNKYIRFRGASSNGKLIGTSVYLKVGDTVQISDSGINDGLYTIKTVGPTEIELNTAIFDVADQLITQITYPADVKMGVIKLVEWDETVGKKVGIASESISRHSVTYLSQDGNNTLDGYPASLMGFLTPYRKARF